MRPPVILLFLTPIGLSPIDKEVIDLEKARTCAFQANYHLIWATKYRRKVLLGSVEVRLVEVLKTIADQMVFSCWLLEFIMEITCICLFLLRRRCVFLRWLVFSSVFLPKLLFEEFPEIKLRLWGGHLWSEGYAVRTAGVVTSAKIEEYINRIKCGCSPRKGRVVHSCFSWVGLIFCCKHFPMYDG